MILDEKYYKEYLPTDIKSAHALIQRLRDKLKELEEYKWMYESCSK